MPKKYRSRQEAMEAVLMGAFDTSGIKTAKQLEEERHAKRVASEKAAVKAAADRKKYVQMDDILKYDERDRVRILKLQNIINDPTTAPQEKESASKSIARIKAKGG